MGDALQHASDLRVCNTSLNICCTLIVTDGVGGLNYLNFPHFPYFLCLRSALPRGYLFVIAHVAQYLSIFRKDQCGSRVLAPILKNSFCQKKVLS